MAKYMMPIFLWSTVLIQSWSTAVHGGRSSAGSVSRMAMLEIIRETGDAVWFGVASERLFERSQVAQEEIQLLAAEPERRHQTARLGLLGIGQPLPQLIGRIRNHPRGQG